MGGGGNAPSADGNTSGAAGNPSDGEVDPYPQRLMQPLATILSAIETERPLTSEESQKTLKMLVKVIEVLSI